jgi:hypothetical protein
VHGSLADNWVLDQVELYMVEYNPSIGQDR